MLNASTTQLREWITACRNGDATAKKQLLEHTYGRLLQMARKRLHGNFAILDHQEETADVVQELYVKLLQRWEQVIQPGSEAAAQVEPVELFLGRSARLMRNILSEQMRNRFGRDGSRPQARSLEELGRGQDSSGAKSVLIDEIHVTFFVAGNLPEKQAREVRRTLTASIFTNRLRKAIRKVIKDFPELAQVTVSITR